MTLLFSLLMGLSGIVYLVGPTPIVEGIRNLGYPDYVRSIIGIAKVLGVIALLSPRTPRLREWAYAGFVFDLILAFLSHVMSHDGANAFHPVLPGGLLMVSYYLRQRNALVAAASNGHRPVALERVESQAA